MKSIKIQHLILGTLINQTFVDAVQFKLFLKMVNGCLSLNNDLTFFNGEDFLVNIPKKVLKECIITTTSEVMPISDHILSKVKKSPIEQPA